MVLSDEVLRICSGVHEGKDIYMARDIPAVVQHEQYTKNREKIGSNATFRERIFKSLMDL